MATTTAALCAALLLAQATPQEGERPKTGQETPRQMRAFTFQQSPDGQVELTVRETDPATGKPVEKTYKADSLDEFRKKYPDVARTYGVDRLADGAGDLGKSFEEWKKHFDDRWFWDRQPGGDFDGWFKDLPKSFPGEELGKWIEEQRKLFEKFRGIQPKGPEEERDRPDKRELGILAAPVGETMAHQLELEAHQGAVIADVRTGSLAAKSGLRKHDIVVKVNDQVVEGPEGLRKSVQESLEKGLTLEVIRGGKRQTLKIEPEKQAK